MRQSALSSPHQETQRRRAVDAPAFECLPPRVQLRLMEESQALPKLPAVPVRAVLEADVSSFEQLADPLSSAFQTVCRARKAASRSSVEAETLTWLERKGDLLSTDPLRFRETLLLLNRRVSPALNGWRSGEAGLATNGTGRAVLFPPADLRPAQLAKLRHMFFDEERTALFRAIVAIALLTNCHPFRDGNGRVARIIFNLVLRRGGMPGDVYIPIYEIARRSRGGFELALRRAELLGDWAALMEYFLKALHCCRTLAR